MKSKFAQTSRTSTAAAPRQRPDRGRAFLSHFAGDDAVGALDIAGHRGYGGLAKDYYRSGAAGTGGAHAAALGASRSIPFDRVASPDREATPWSDRSRPDRSSGSRERAHVALRALPAASMPNRSGDPSGFWRRRAAGSTWFRDVRTRGRPGFRARRGRVVPRRQAQRRASTASIAIWSSAATRSRSCGSPTNRGTRTAASPTASCTEKVGRAGQRAARRHGVTKGDRVAHLPADDSSRPCYAMLACARIGAVHSVVFAGFSAEIAARPHCRRRLPRRDDRRTKGCAAARSIALKRDRRRSHRRLPRAHGARRANARRPKCRCRRGATCGWPTR